MLLYINDTNIYEEKIRNCKKQQKARILPGGMGNGLERAYSKNFIIICCYNISKIIWILLVLIQDEIKILQISQNLKF